MIGNSAPITGKSVLIVDGCEDNREVLGTALRRLGIQTIEATGVEQGLRMAREFHPEVIVLDLESNSAENEEIQNKYDAETLRHNSTLVILGSVRMRAPESATRKTVTKPYHYAPLIRTIEQLASR